MPSRFAIYHPSGQTAIKTDMLGKDIANLELLRAFAQFGGYEHLHISTHHLVSADELVANLLEGTPGPRITTSTIMAQHTAVHVGSAARALGQLIASPDLRRRMGAAGRARGRDAFDWPVVVRAYNALADELTEIRNAAPVQQPSHRVNPLKGDPFADFVGFATHQLTPRTPLRLRAGASVTDLQRAAGVQLDGAFAEWRGSLEEATLLLERLAKGNALTAQELLADFPTERHPVLLMSLAWLAKLGIVDWLEPDLKVLHFY